MPKRDFDLDFEFDTNSWGELDFASEGEMKEGEEVELKDVKEVGQKEVGESKVKTEEPRASPVRKKRGWAMVS